MYGWLATCHILYKPNISGNRDEAAAAAARSLDEPLDWSNVDFDQLLTRLEEFDFESGAAADDYSSQ